MSEHEQDPEERERKPGEDRRSLQWSEPTGEAPAEGGERPAATPAPGTGNVAGHVDSEGMAIGMESGEEISPTGRGADQRVAPPGTRLPGAVEPADVTHDPPAPGQSRSDRITPESQPVRDEDSDDAD